VSSACRPRITRKKVDGELRADARPAPRPGAGNIGLKFEWCFKGRDESNLNAAVGRQRSRVDRAREVPMKSALPSARQQSLTFAVGATITIRETDAGAVTAAAAGTNDNMSAPLSKH